MWLCFRRDTVGIALMTSAANVGGALLCRGESGVLGVDGVVIVAMVVKSVALEMVE